MVRMTITPTLLANKSETFGSLKFTLEGTGERVDGNARTSAQPLPDVPEGPAFMASPARVVAAAKVVSAEFTAVPKAAQFLGKIQAAGSGGDRSRC